MISDKILVCCFCPKPEPNCSLGFHSFQILSSLSSSVPFPFPVPFSTFCDFQQWTLKLVGGTLASLEKFLLSLTSLFNQWNAPFTGRLTCWSCWNVTKDRWFGPPDYCQEKPHENARTTVETRPIGTNTKSSPPLPFYYSRTDMCSQTEERWWLGRIRELKWTSCFFFKSIDRVNSRLKTKRQKPPRVFHLPNYEKGQLIPEYILKI